MLGCACQIVRHCCWAQIHTSVHGSHNARQSLSWQSLSCHAPSGCSADASAPAQGIVCSTALPRNNTSGTGMLHHTSIVRSKQHRSTKCRYALIGARMRAGLTANTRLHACWPDAKTNNSTAWQAAARCSLPDAHKRKHTECAGTAAGTPASATSTAQASLRQRLPAPLRPAQVLL